MYSECVHTMQITGAHLSLDCGCKNTVFPCLRNLPIKACSLGGGGHGSICKKKKVSTQSTVDGTRACQRKTYERRSAMLRPWFRNPLLHCDKGAITVVSRSAAHGVALVEDVPRPQHRARITKLRAATLSAER